MHALADGITRAELEQACDRLVVSATCSCAAEGARLRFRHGLVREAAYASLAKAARARLHERHAEWLERLGGELPEADARIGFHLEAACRYEQEIAGAMPERLVSAAGRRLEAAARVARARGDLLGEIGFLDRAVALLGTDRAQGVELLPALVSALFGGGRSDPRGGLARARGVDERRARPPARRGASGDRARADPALSPPGELRRPGGGHRRPSGASARCARRRRARAARADYLMSDLTWLLGDPEGPTPTPSACSPTRAAPESGVRHRDGADLHGLVPGRGAVPGRRRRSPASMRSTSSGRPARRRAHCAACRAVFAAMTGHFDGPRTPWPRRSRASRRCTSARSRLHGAARRPSRTLAGDPAAAERALRDADAPSLGLRTTTGTCR